MTMSHLLIQYLNMQSLSYEMYLFTVGKSNQISSFLNWALKTYNMITWLWNWGQGNKPSSRETCSPRSEYIYTQYHCPTMHRDWETELNLKI
jgi:hypothetical protein